MDDFPIYFPLGWNRRLAGMNFNEHRKKKFSVVFQDFGTLGNVDVACSYSDAEWKPSFTTQRQGKVLSYTKIPALPLSTKPAKVPYPFKDIVIGDLWTLSSSVQRFRHSLARTAAYVHAKPKPKWYARFQRAKKKMDTITEGTKISDAQLNTIESNLPKSIQHLVKEYGDIVGHECYSSCNFNYSGGLASCVSGEDVSKYSDGHLLVHAKGPQLNKLTVTLAEPSTTCPGLVNSRTLAESSSSPIFQVSAYAVEGSIYVGVRHKQSYSVFSFSGNSEDWPCLTTDCGSDDRVEEESLQMETCLDVLGVYSLPEGSAATSVTVNPYLAGECLFCSNNSTVFLWTAERGVWKTLDRPPRFECQDLWMQAYYASHPRHLVVADRTAVQMMDQRDGFHSTVDLFALPSSLVHSHERILAATCHKSLGSPLHFISLGQSVLVVDQRFAGTPVMQWYPDTKAPVLYLDSTCCRLGDNEMGDNSSLVLLGSQYPAEAICYSLNSNPGKPLTSPYIPWRLSQASDIAKTGYAKFLNCPDHAVLMERLDSSSSGLALAAANNSAGPVIAYQTDCYGEIFYQTLTFSDVVDRSSFINTQSDVELTKETLISLGDEATGDVPSPTSGINRKCSSSANGTTSQQQAFRSGSFETASGGMDLPSWVQTHVQSWARKLRESVDSGQVSSVESSTIESTAVTKCGVAAVWNLSEILIDAKEQEGGDCPLQRRSDEVILPPQEDMSSEICIVCGKNIGTRQCRCEARTVERTSSTLIDTGGGDASTTRNLSLLDQVAPPVCSYKPNPSTSLHLRLMEGSTEDSKEDFTNILKQRELERFQLLEKYKERHREKKKRKKARLVAAANGSQHIVGNEDETTGQAHLMPHRILGDANRLETEPISVFNSKEHQKQNAYIRDIFSNMKSEMVAAHALKTSDDESASLIESENTPLGSDLFDASVDLFDSVSGAEEILDKSLPAGRSLGDDDEFFSFNSDFGLSQTFELPSPAVTARDRTLDQ